MSSIRRVAIACDNDQGLESPVSGHFGHCPYFAMVDLVDGRATTVNVVANPAAQNHQPGQVPRFIATAGADAIIAGGMGRMAVTLFERLYIDVASGASGSAGAALAAWLDGSLTGAVPCAQSEAHHAEGGHHSHHPHDA
ncbi:MAG: dinitrogenase iron-molybdenum cofactor biosynthesis protein [Deltaproteobacteria bacterium HGW-Deltaproteobacteria-14]|jgi:predicted Fe-Mo cluster-binding NifX family protein|nr:MAG: dinitrogenase iron-molybdenum cofactor biosynthesis protein [Deltaproteobacteria bacterium HGW-Deltaproteobacteria-14]